MREGDAPDVATDDDIAGAIWRSDNVELVTVGIDIGSATSHLTFARLRMQRQTQRFSSRFVLVERVTLAQSPVVLTPYRADGLIDVDALKAFVDDAYREANIERSRVDAGAVILTGVALERANARAIAELFASEGGKFVCAAAGHNLEARFAAHGSGAVARSRADGPVLNIDIGGGTTKLALAVEGHVRATMAISAGARLVVLDPSGRLVRVEPAGAELGRELGISLDAGTRLDGPERVRLARALANRIVDAASGRPSKTAVLAGMLPDAPRPSAITLSGGVAEIVASSDARSYGDLGPELAAAIRERAADLPAPIVTSAERIRATVVGASHFSVQLSGNTVHVTDDALLPRHNVPVVAIAFSDRDDAPAVTRKIDAATEAHDLRDSEDAIAIAVEWVGTPYYARLRALATGIHDAHRAAPRRGGPVIIALAGDIGSSLGRILSDELAVRAVVAIDGLELADLDYLDIGERIQPANVVPVIIKSLIFPDAPPSGPTRGARTA